MGLYKRKMMGFSIHITHNGTIYQPKRTSKERRGEKQIKRKDGMSVDHVATIPDWPGIQSQWHDI